MVLSRIFNLFLKILKINEWYHTQAALELQNESFSNALWIIWWPYLDAVVSVRVLYALAERTPRLQEDEVVEVVHVQHLSLPALWAEASMLAKDELDVLRR